MDDPQPTRSVAVACQGGGSHTAFTAGALKRVIGDDRCRVVALSGASGGAVCALLAWYGLVNEDPHRGAELLDAFWTDTAATAAWDVALNATIVAASRLEGVVTLPAFSPYWYPSWAQNRFRKELQRLVPELERLVPEGRVNEQDHRPMLLVSAIDALAGKFMVFSSQGARHYREAEKRSRHGLKHHRLTVDAILASAAVPTLFRAVHVDGGVCWDGLFSQNPPIHDLPDEPAQRPEEIWIIQINPETRTDEPTSVADILDRRNELSGNLSLYQEVASIEKMNELIAKKAFTAERMDRYKNVEIRFIQMDAGFAQRLDTASKLDRSPQHIEDLMAHGWERADAFLVERLRK